MADLTRQPVINPRATWAGDRRPKTPATPEDVRFLVVHHSASWNGHTGNDAPQILRAFYDYHTGPAKNWGDIAYNFLIDADGGIWEGRSGSLDGPVAGDATGGNQGFSQLVCLIGDFTDTQPSQASVTSLVGLLAWLADRHDIPTTPGTQVSFVSRGSNRHPAGTNVTTATITGHRTMSRTTCPGDQLNRYVEGALTADVAAIRSVATSTFAPPTSIVTTTTTTPMSTAAVTGSEMTTTAAVTGSEMTTTPSPVAEAQPEDPEDEVGGPTGALAGTGAAIVLLGAGVVIWRHRRINGR